ncbi:hypothetical protein BO94DRAFT_477389, partial [Aspergillus sclerotioniger CBS 115572]
HKKTDLYLFHDLCWHRLHEHLNPEEVPLVCLYEALECMPLPVGGRPWAARELPSRSGSSPWLFSEDQKRIIPNGHFGLPTLEELMRFAKDPPKPLETTAERPAVQHPTDPFQRLPMEIIETIGVLLSTRDVLHLRQASRAATPLFSSSTFWRTRFDINGEHGFLLPVIKDFTNPDRRRDIGWILLYHCTCHLNCSGWFQFEIHAWEALRWLRDTAVAIHSGQPRPLAFRGNALHHYHHTTYRGMHLESVDIVPSLRQIAISVLQDTGNVCITGMEFIFADRPSVMLGYTTPGAKLATSDMYRKGYAARDDWPYPGIRLILDVRVLRGIAAHRGLNCVRVVSVIHGFEEDDGPDQDSRQPYSVGCDVRLTVRQARGFLAMDEVKRVVAVFDSRGMIDIGVLGIATRRIKGSAQDRWEKIIDIYKTAGSIPSIIEFR